MWSPPTWRGGSTAPGHGRRSVHRRTPPRAHSEFEGACLGNVEDLSSPTFLKNVLEQPWHGAGFHRLASATHPISQQGCLWSSDRVVMQLHCSCKSDLFLPSSWQQCWQCWCTWWTPQVVRKTSWPSTRSGWRPSGQRRGSPSNIHSGDLRPSGRRLLVGLSASFLTTIEMLTKFCLRSSKNYSWIMLACSGFTHPPEFQLFKVKQRWNFVQLTRSPLMEPKRLKACANKEPK